MEDSSDIPQQVDEYLAVGDETTPIEALMLMSRALASLELGGAHDRLIEVPAKTAEQMVLMMVDYRRLLEGVGSQIAALPTAQREIALTAYQSMCRMVFDVLSAIECLLKAAP